MKVNIHGIELNDVYSRLHRNLVMYDGKFKDRLNISAQGEQEGIRAATVAMIEESLRKIIEPSANQGDLAYGLRLMAEITGSDGLPGCYEPYAVDSIRNLADSFNGVFCQARHTHDKPIQRIHVSVGSQTTRTIELYGGSGETSSTWSPKNGGK